MQVSTHFTFSRFYKLIRKMLYFVFVSCMYILLNNFSITKADKLFVQQNRILY